MKRWFTNNRWLAIGIAGTLLLVITGLLMQGPESEAAELLVEPKRSSFEVTVTSTGELRAKNSVEITGPSRARQARIYDLTILRMIPEGTVVEKGDFVAELDRSDLNTSIEDAQLDVDEQFAEYEQTQIDTSITLSEARDQQVDLRYAMEEAKLQKQQATYEAPSVKRQAEIDYEKAERTYERALENYKKQVKKAETQMRQEQADLSKARRELNQFKALAEDFTIRAPEKGMLIYRRDDGQKIKEGSSVRVWHPVVATLPDLSVMESITYINEVDIQKVDEGQPVEIGLDADPDKKLTGTVVDVANIGEQRSSSSDAKVFRVAIEVNEADTTLRPAMTTSNTIIVDRVSDVLHVPLEAIHADDSLTYVFAKQGGRTVRQEVEIGLINENSAAIETGLTTDEEVYLSMPADTSGLPLRKLEKESALAEES